MAQIHSTIDDEWSQFISNSYKNNNTDSDSDSDAESVDTDFNEDAVAASSTFESLKTGGVEAE